MSSQKFCTECGTDVQSGSSFCDQCGASLDSTESPVEPREEQTATSPHPTSTPDAPAARKSRSGLILILALVGGGLFLAVIAGVGVTVWKLTTTAHTTEAATHPSNSSEVIFENFESSSEIDGEGSITSDTLRPDNYAWEAIGDGDMAYFFLPASGITPGEEVEISFEFRITLETIINHIAQPTNDLNIRLRLMNSEGNSIVGGASSVISESWQTVTARLEVPDNPPYDLGIEIMQIEGPILFDNITIRNLGGSPTPPVAELNARGFPIDQWLAEQNWFQEIIGGLPEGVSLSIDTSEEADWDNIEVREHHSPDSGYDPNVSPMYGMFRVNEARDTIEWFEPVSGDYVPLQRFLDQ
tara:strand:- start:574 stop:1641 length:1068 start_codon:yes stop_codon:yes gene_type:complete